MYVTKQPPFSSTTKQEPKLIVLIKHIGFQIFAKSYISISPNPVEDCLIILGIPVIWPNVFYLCQEERVIVCPILRYPLLLLAFLWCTELCNKFVIQPLRDTIVDTISLTCWATSTTTLPVTWLITWSMTPPASYASPPAWYHQPPSGCESGILRSIVVAGTPQVTGSCQNQYGVLQPAEELNSISGLRWTDSREGPHCEPGRRSVRRAQPITNPPVCLPCCIPVGIFIKIEVSGGVFSIFAMHPLLIPFLYWTTKLFLRTSMQCRKYGTDNMDQWLNGIVFGF